MLNITYIKIKTRLISLLKAILRFSALTSPSIIINAYINKFCKELYNLSFFIIILINIAKF